MSLYNIIWENWVKYGFERDFTIEVCKKKDLLKIWKFVPL